MKKAFITFFFLLVCASLFFTQDEYIKIGDNLVVVGIPRIPVSLVEEVERYSEFRSAYFSSWHPIKRQMIIHTRFGDSYQAHLVNSPGGARTQLTFFKDAVYFSSFDQKKGAYFVFAKDIGGNEILHKYRYDFSTGDITLLTSGKSGSWGGKWSNSGEFYAYLASLINEDDAEEGYLCVMNPAESKTDRLLSQLKGWFDIADWSPDDRKILLIEDISTSESYLWIIDSQTGEKRLITPEKGKEKVVYADGEFSKDGNGIYVITDKNSEFLRLAYIDLLNLKHTYLTEEIPWDVDELELSPDRSKAAFVTNENGISVLHLLDLPSGKELPLPKMPLGILNNWGPMRWHKNGEDIGLTLESPHSAGDAYSINIESGVLECWTHSETGGLNPNSFSEPEIVKWETFDGLTLSAFLCRPHSRFSGKRPVIIKIHGGPSGQARYNFKDRDNFYLNELGIAVLYPNIRGSGGYGKSFSELDNGYLRENAYRDIGSLLDWIKTHPDLDSERVMVMGSSYGGHMTLAVATRYSDKIRCAVSVVGMSNLVTFLEKTAMSDFRRAEYGDERDPRMREFLLRVAPLNNITSIQKPLFIIQGANDPRVPVSEAEQMVKALKEQGKPVWYLLAKDEGHEFGKKENQDIQFYSIVLFIKEFLLK